MTATLRSSAIPGLGVGSRRLVVDCRHGTTYVDQFIPPGTATVFSERSMIAIAVERHEIEEGCGCARGLDTLARVRKGMRA
jgi:hypothetical protein